MYARENEYVCVCICVSICVCEIESVCIRRPLSLCESRSGGVWVCVSVCKSAALSPVFMSKRMCMLVCVCVKLPLFSPAPGVGPVRCSHWRRVTR